MDLRGKRVAILAENTYEDQELWYPYYRLLEDGADVFVVGTGTATVYASKHGYPVKVDAEADTVDASQFDMIVIPGGWAPDLMRRSQAMVNLVRQAHAQGRFVAAICHAGWMLCSANIIRGRRVTSARSIKDDMVNAGGIWLDEEVVRDGRIITARKPSDLPAFMRAVGSALREVALPATNGAH
ncbi:MAG: type 1 glutamine amidotransferase domain-containing protein [Chloroflexota bacterium]